MVDCILSNSMSQRSQLAYRCADGSVYEVMAYYAPGAAGERHGG